eukprot:s1631_g4.t1
MLGDSGVIVLRFSEFSLRFRRSLIISKHFNKQRPPGEPPDEEKAQLAAGAKRLMEEMGWTPQAQSRASCCRDRKRIRSKQMVPRDPFYRRPIEVLSLHPDPFWGLPTSIVDWCEANYAHTPYVAEFFNTLTAVPMVAVSVWGLYLCVRYGLELRFYLCWVGIGAVGVGTLAFHAMLHPVGQATDELAMICASMVFLYVVLEADYLEAHRPWLPAMQSLGTAYFTSPFFFPFFVAAYGCTVLLIIFQAYRVYKLYAAEDRMFESNRFPQRRWWHCDDTNVAPCEAPCEVLRRGEPAGCPPTGIRKGFRILSQSVAGRLPRHRSECKARRPKPLTEFLADQDYMGLTTLEDFANNYVCRGEKLAAVSMHSMLNDRYYGQWLGLNRPFRRLEEFMESAPEARSNAFIDTIVRKIQAQKHLVKRYLDGDTPALHLHAMFHIATTISPYCYVVFMTYHRCTVLKRDAEHRRGLWSYLVLLASSRASLGRRWPSGESKTPAIAKPCRRQESG